MLNDLASGNASSPELPFVGLEGPGAGESVVRERAFNSECSPAAFLGIDNEIQVELSIRVIVERDVTRTTVYSIRRNWSGLRLQGCSVSAEPCWLEFEGTRHTGIDDHNEWEHD